jgi:hypothetical protein
MARKITKTTRKGKKTQKRQRGGQGILTYPVNTYKPVDVQLDGATTRQMYNEQSVMNSRSSPFLGGKRKTNRKGKQRKTNK